MYCNQCGQSVERDSNYCSQCGARIVAPAAGPGAGSFPSKDEVLSAIKQAMADKPGLSLVCGQKTDIEISNILADADWTVGRKKVTYSARVLADAGARTIIFWDMIKETGSGLGIFFSFKAEKYRSDGKTLSGTVKEAGYGQNGKIIDYQWDYSQIRHLIENIVRAKGWQFKTVLLKGKAAY